MLNFFSKSFFVALTFLSAGVFAQTTTTTWVEGNTGDWSDPANWSDGVPQNNATTFDALITEGDVTQNLSGGVTVEGLRLESNSPLQTFDVLVRLDNPITVTENFGLRAGAEIRGTAPADRGQLTLLPGVTTDMHFGIIRNVDVTGDLNVDGSGQTLGLFDSSVTGTITLFDTVSSNIPRLRVGGEVVIDEIIFGPGNRGRLNGWSGDASGGTDATVTTHLILNGPSTTSHVHEIAPDRNASLTFAPGSLIEGGGTDFRSSIDPNSFSGDLYVIRNEGTIRANQLGAGASNIGIRVRNQSNADDRFENAGLMEATDGSYLSFTNERFVNEGGGTVRVNHADSSIRLLSGSWSNEGVFQAVEGDFELGGNFTPEDLGDFEATGSTGRFVIRGTLDITDESTGDTLVINDSTGNLFFNNRLTGDSMGSDTRVLGGTIDLQDGRHIEVLGTGDVAGTHFQGTTVTGGDILLNNNAARLIFEADGAGNGPSVEGGAVRLNAVQNANLQFNGDQTIENLHVVSVWESGVSNTSAPNYLRFRQDGDVIFGANVLVEGAFLNIGQSSTSGSSLLNQGVIRANQEAISQTPLRFDSSFAFTNEGLVEARDGGTLQFRNAPHISNFDTATGTLTGGSWAVHDNSAIHFNDNLTGVPILVNAADILLSGENAQWLTGSTSSLSNGLAGLAENQGVLTLSDSHTLSLDGNFENTGDLAVESGARLELADGEFVQTAGSTVVNDGTLAASGGFRFEAGNLQIDGTLEGDTVLAGNTEIGFSAGLFTVDGSLDLESGGVLNMELGNPVSLNYDRVEVTGALQLGGTLEVSLLPGYNPAEGDTFNLLDAATMSGDFANVNLPSLSGGLAWNTSALSTDGNLSVIPEPGVVGLLLFGGIIGMQVRRRHKR